MHPDNNCYGNLVYNSIKIIDLNNNKYFVNFIELKK